MKEYFIVNDKKEVLDQDRDVFFLCGVEPYYDRNTAIERAFLYKGSDPIFLSVNGKIQKIKLKGKRSFGAVTMMALIKMEESCKRAETPDERAELQEELILVLRNIVNTYGIWIMTDLNNQKRFIRMVANNFVFTKEEFWWQMVKDL